MRILLTEDDGVLADAVENYLTQHHLAVDRAPDGESADTWLKSERFDLAILDLGLPRMDGFEVLRRLRARRQMLPVLILTARDAINDRVEGLNLGADDYLVKPFALPELLARVRALIRRSQAGTPPEILHGPLSLDTIGHRVHLQGKPLELPGREWALLEYLLHHVGRVVSKEQLVQGISTSDEELSLSAIEVYISRLRSRLESSGISIRTVRGYGYLLENWRDEPQG